MRVAITGISGSLGSALLAQFAATGAERIVGFSRDEQKRAALQAKYAFHPGVKIYAGDVREERRMVDVFKDCEVVIHAAARKVVSGHNDEPREMLSTNVLGTMNVIQAARDAGVRKLLFISSDKAVHAENVYGVSKALAEHLVISENARSWAQGLRLSVMRYGNVLASNGSVMRIWRRQIAAREPLTLTDPAMTRFWLTLDMAVGFVVRALENMRGGEVFVPGLRAAGLTTLAHAAYLASDAPEPLGWTQSGIRAGGEKLHEELLSDDEVRRTRIRNGFYIVAPPDTSESWDTTRWLGDLVGPDFAYRSDTWPDRWTADELRDLVSERVPA